MKTDAYSGWDDSEFTLVYGSQSLAFFIISFEEWITDGGLDLRC